MREPKLTIAFTCVGRRVQLVRHFRHACRQLGVEPYLIGLDSSPARSPAAYYCDEAIGVPNGSDAGFVETIDRVVTERQVGLLVPLADPDLFALAAIRDRLAGQGCLPAFCGPQTTAIARDKLNTFAFFQRIGLRTPRTQLLAEAVVDRHTLQSGFVKPRFGSAGKHAFPVDNGDLPAWLLERRQEFVFQERLIGQEVTVDVFIDNAGNLRCVVPRHRLEVRGGEVTKSIVRCDEQIDRQMAHMVAALPDAFGVLCIQGFLQSDGCVHWTEINPRFGGGSPLAIEAGAPFPQWLVSLAVGRTPDYRVSIADGLTMLRFDDAIYVDSQGGARPGSDARVVCEPPVPLADPPRRTP